MKGLGVAVRLINQISISSCNYIAGVKKRFLKYRILYILNK
jgi:hypothetical protein